MVMRTEEVIMSDNCKLFLVMISICVMIAVSVPQLEAAGTPGVNRPSETGSQRTPGTPGTVTGTREVGANKPVWEATSWQSSLPPIVVTNKQYSFEELIRADGYLCPGSAMAYKTLQTALPLLFAGATPAQDDFTISYGPSECSQKVFNYAMGSNSALDSSLLGREQIVTRTSTGVRVRIVYDKPATDGHTPEAAAAADLILRATDGAGMKVEVIRPGGETGAVEDVAAPSATVPGERHLNQPETASPSDSSPTVPLTIAIVVILAVIVGIIFVLVSGKKT